MALNLKQFQSEVDEIAKRMQDDFGILEELIRQNLPNEKRKFLNANALGTVSYFLDMGNGYEAAYDMYRKNITDIKEAAEGVLEPEDGWDDESEEEGEDEE